MSRHPQYGDGAHGVQSASGATGGSGVPGVHDAPGTADGPQGPPNVYQPQPAETPAYDEYTDPAAAHGWQNAYDETDELPRVADDTAPLPVLAGPGRGRVAPRPAHKKRSGLRSRRGAVAAGAVGAVALVAVIAGVSLSGSSSGGPEEKSSHAGTGAASTGDQPTDAGSATGSPDGTTPSGSADGSTSPGASGSAPAAGDGSGKPTAGSSASATSSGPTTATSSTVTGPSNSTDRPGHGKGGTKGPK